MRVPGATTLLGAGDWQAICPFLTLRTLSPVMPICSQRSCFSPSSRPASLSFVDASFELLPRMSGTCTPGTAVAVGGTAVAVGGSGVEVGGSGVAVGGTAVAVGGSGVEVGGSGVAVGGTAVG